MSTLSPRSRPSTRPRKRPSRVHARTRSTRRGRRRCTTTLGGIGARGQLDLDEGVAGGDQVGAVREHLDLDGGLRGGRGQQATRARDAPNSFFISCSPSVERREAPCLRPLVRNRTPGRKFPRRPHVLRGNDFLPSAPARPPTAAAPRPPAGGRRSAAPVQTGSPLGRVTDVHLERRAAERRQPGRRAVRHDPPVRGHPAARRRRGRARDRVGGELTRRSGVALHDALQERRRGEPRGRRGRRHRRVRQPGRAARHRQARRLRRPRRSAAGGRSHLRGHRRRSTTGEDDAEYGPSRRTRARSTGTRRPAPSGARRTSRSPTARCSTPTSCGRRAWRPTPRRP